MLLAGEVGKPHGILGEVYVVPISDDPRRFEPGSRLLRADGRAIVVVDSRVHGNRLLVKFEGTDTRTDAEGLRGPLFIPGDLVRDLGDDEYWQYDLAGCRVVDVRGSEIGVVTRIDQGVVHDLIAVDTERGERLVPMVKDLVVEVDVEGRLVVVDAPDGLWD